MSAGALESFAQRFAARALAREEWTHEAHLRVGLWYVARHGGSAALLLLRRDIAALNESFGNRNTATDGYHETITAAYVSILARYRTASPDVPLDHAISRLLASPLADKALLLQCWTEDLLMSSTARLGWVEPDRRPLADLPVEAYARQTSL